MLESVVQIGFFLHSLCLGIRKINGSDVGGMLIRTGKVQLGSRCFCCGGGVVAGVEIVRQRHIADELRVQLLVFHHDLFVQRVVKPVDLTVVVSQRGFSLAYAVEPGSGVEGDATAESAQEYQREKKSMNHTAFRLT